MNYLNYLLNLSSGNSAPLSLVGGNSYLNEDVDIQALLRLIESEGVAPRYRMFFVNEDDTIQSEVPLEDILQGGSYSENYQNGQRCSLSITLYNQSGKYTPTINKLWAGTKFRFDAGEELADGSILWIQKGIFVITSPQTNYSVDMRTVALAAGDKFAILEGTLGTLSTTYEIPAGSLISSVAGELLGMQKGNGFPLDSQTPYFHPALAQKKTQVKITKSAGDTVGALIIELANQMGAEVFYNAQGRLCFFPIDVVGEDNDKPILFNYITNKGELTDLNFAFDYSNIINNIVLIGSTVNGGVVKATAANDDPASPLCVQRIGTRTSVINNSDIKTKIVAEENARYQLRKQLILKTSTNLTVPYTPFFGVNNLVMITDDFYDMIKQYFLIQSMSFNFDYGSSMSLTVSNLSNLPFISSYKSQEEILDAEEAEIETYYTITVDLTNGAYRGPSLMTAQGVTYIYLVGNAGYRIPTYESEVAQLVVTGAQYTYNPTTGMVTLYHPTQNITVSGSCYDWWRSTTSLTHCTLTGGSGGTIPISGITTYTVVPDANYYVPDSIVVTNASYVYTPFSDRGSATLEIYNPVGEVNVTVVCSPAISIGVIGTPGVGGWPSNGILVFDGDYPNTVELLTTLDTPNQETVVSVKSSYISFVVSQATIATAALDPGMTEYRSGIGPDNENYIVYKLTSAASGYELVVEANNTAIPTYAIEIYGDAGESGTYPGAGLKIYRGNYLSDSSGELLGTIMYPGSSFAATLRSGIISVVGFGANMFLANTELQGGLQYITEGSLDNGYCIVFNVVGSGEATVITDQAFLLNITMSTYTTGGNSWPSTGVKVYSGTYPDITYRGTITNAGSTYTTRIVGSSVTLMVECPSGTVPQMNPVSTSGGPITYNNSGVDIGSDYSNIYYLTYSLEGSGSINASAGAHITNYTVNFEAHLSSTLRWAAMEVLDGSRETGSTIASFPTQGGEAVLQITSQLITVLITTPDNAPTYSYSGGVYRVLDSGWMGPDYYVTFDVGGNGGLIIYE